MFKKSRGKIVCFMMTILVMVWVSMLSAIYVSSYLQMLRQNRDMLQAYAQMYHLQQEKEEENPENPRPPFPGESQVRMKPGFVETPRFQLSVFYSVALTYEGEILEINHDSPSVHTDEELAELAKKLSGEAKSSGREKNLSFYKADKDGYVLVAFMDNTILNENARTLFRFTLIFGGMVLLVFYFLAVYLAKRIVQPLEESYQKQKQFISDAGHELKTPIAVISANAELLERELGENQWLANIQYEMQRMGLLVTQLLKLARTESKAPQTEKMDFSHVVEKEVLAFEAIAYEHKLFLTHMLTEGIFVKGDIEQLKQLVSILIDNAIRHSARATQGDSSQADENSSEKEQEEIRVTLKKEHGWAILSVRNKGQAIPQEQQKKIFERFYRMDTVRNESEQHYGLGLAIAKAITQSHQGKIKVECRDGFVEFIFQMPLYTK